MKVVTFALGFQRQIEFLQTEDKETTTDKEMRLKRYPLLLHRVYFILMQSFLRGTLEISSPEHLKAVEVLQLFTKLGLIFTHNKPYQVQGHTLILSILQMNEADLCKVTFQQCSFFITLEILDHQDVEQPSKSVS